MAQDSGAGSSSEWHFLVGLCRYAFVRTTGLQHRVSPHVNWTLFGELVGPLIVTDDPRGLLVAGVALHVVAGIWEISAPSKEFFEKKKSVTFEGLVRIGEVLCPVEGVCAAAH